MWNTQVSGLLNGTTICIFDGSPSGSKDRPDWSVLWRFASDVRATFFGAGAAFFANCMKKALLIYARKPELQAAQGTGDAGRTIEIVKRAIYNG